MNYTRTMDWQPAPSLNVIGRRCSSYFGRCSEADVRVIQFVRSCHQNERVPSPKRKRVSLPPPRAAQVDVAIQTDESIGSIIDRKRNALPDAVDSMKSLKRRRFELDPPSEWRAQEWHKQHIRNLSPATISTRHSPRQRQPLSPAPSYPIRRQPRAQPLRYSPYKRPIEKKTREIKLYRQEFQPYDFLWADEGSEDSPAPEEQGVVQMADIHQQDLAPVRPMMPKQPTPPPSDSEGHSHDDSDFDEEGNREFRLFLRNMPESYNGDGYRVAIDSIISPESKTWNLEHKRDLVKQAIARNETPSKVPEPPISTPPPNQLTIPQRNESVEPVPKLSLVKTIFSKIKSGQTWFSPRRSQPEPKEESASPAPARDVEEGEPQAQTATETADCNDQSMPEAEIKEEPPNTSPTAEVEAQTKEDTSRANLSVREPETPAKPESSKTPRDAFVTPAQQFSKLSLYSRTPKASAFQSVKTERKTRYQQRLQELEAAKDKYKLVPLGPDWDCKVRNAVKTGMMDASNSFKKYTETDFSRVVPEYSVVPGHDNWLNDVVINDYLSLIVKHGNSEDRPTQVPSHAAMVSHAWTKINEDPKSLPTRWAKKQGIQGKNILECEKIFFPINSGMHWTLCVVEPKYHRRITVYNSMGSSRGQYVAERILAYLKHEVGATFNENEWTINPAGLSPQQQNADDCGVFTITTARQIMLGQMEKAPYGPEIMPTQRKRIVAELVNGGLLSTEESKQ